MSYNDAVFASTSSDGTVNVWEFVLPSENGGELKKFEPFSCSWLNLFLSESLFIFAKHK